MKTIILAGGWGSRLGDRTLTTPKPMLMIGNKPVLWHIMKIYSHYNMNDFIVCLGVQGSVIKDYFMHFDMNNNDFTVDTATKKVEFHRDRDEAEWKITLVDTGLNTLKGARIKKVEKYLDPGINMVTYGDGVANVNIADLLEFHKSHGKILTITGVQPPARFGEIIEKKGKIIGFHEKPQTSVGLINGGFMVFNRKMLDYLTMDESCDFEIGPLERMVDEGEVMVFKHDKQWACMDHERDYVFLNKLWNDNKAFWKIWD